VVWAALLAVTAALAQAAPAAAEPTADFRVEPAVPIAGDLGTYKAELSGGLGNGNANVQWDFNRDGRFDKRGHEVEHRFGAPGVKQVTMRVVRNGEVRASVTKPVVVAPRPPGESPPPPEPEPEPPDDDDEEEEPGPVAPAPPLPPVELPAPPSGDDSVAPSEETAGAALMTPFPVVRIAGVLMPWGARVRLLTVRGPAGATVTARCTGAGCPLRSVRRRVRSGRLRVRSFERRLRAGVRVEIFVRKAGLIGKYTRFRIRGRALPLKRVDRCLRPGAREPVRCPST
jgi:hypothetical protein